MKNKRLIYFCVFIVILAVEISIALFVRDSFIRPYVGDVLVVPLLIAFLRIIFPSGKPLLPLFTILLAFAVEFVQYFDIVRLMGLSGNILISTIIGRTFDPGDLISYAAGGILFFIAERIILKFLSKQDE